MTSTSLDDRLYVLGPKRILALDGGGIRGLLSLGFLAQIETVLRMRYENDHLVLADYFDLIGGTSTGAGIAAALSMGGTVANVKSLYLQMGEEAFTPAAPRWFPEKLRNAALFVPAARFSMTLGSREVTFGGRNPWAARFRSEPLEKLLREHLGEDVTLGSERVRTGLCIIAENVSTGSTWPLHNGPRGVYYKRNKDIPLWKAVRASTAAPVYFLPEVIDYGNGEASFIDGGVSMANNPALQLFLICRLEGYRFCWGAGADKLLLVSVGTGTWSRKEHAERALQSRIWNWAANVPDLLMGDATRQNQLLLQSMARSLTQTDIDREVDSFRPYQLTREPLLTYVRYNVDLESKSLSALGFPQFENEAEARMLREMSAAENCDILAKIGEVAGRKRVRPEHLPTGFDLLSGDRHQQPSEVI